MKEVDNLIWIMSPFILVAIVCDFLTDKIPNRLVIAGSVVFCGYRLWTEGVAYAPEMLAGMILPVVLLFFLFHIRALGGGDMKMFSMLGILFGFHILKVIVYAFMFGACQSLIRLLLNQSFFQTHFLLTEQKHTIHFALAIGLGALYVAFDMEAAFNIATDMGAVFGL